MIIAYKKDALRTDHPFNLLLKPCFHGSQHVDERFFFNDVRNHRVKIVQKRAREHTMLIGKGLIAVEDSGVAHFHADTAAHDADLFNARVREPGHFPPCDGFDFFDFL